MVTAADGSAWYQVATGEGSAAFYDVPEFSGSAMEESQVRETFPGVEEGTSLRTVEQGVPGGYRRKWQCPLVQQRLL